MTIILVDGPDGVGKTGYAEWLADEIGFLFLRLEPDKDFGWLDGEVIERMSSVFNYTLVQLDRQDVDVVVDRGPVSSIVYSNVFDREDPDHARSTLDRIDPKIVYLRCDARELAIRYEDEKFENVKEIAEEYDRVMESLDDLGYTVETVDTSSGAPGQLDDVTHYWLVENAEQVPAND